VSRLANIKSAKKRVLVTATKTARNKSIKSAVKTSIKKVEAAVEAKNKEEAQAALTAAVSTISKAANKGIYHKNNAARKVSRLTKLVNEIA
jgi:small subunit ribosomal protein S20